MPRLSPPIYLAILATLGIGGAAGGRYLITRPTGPELEPPATSAPTPDEPAAPAAPSAPTVIPATPATVTPTFTGARTQGECGDDGRRLCPGLYSPDATIKASWKLDLVACLEEHRAELDAACVTELDTHAAANDEVKTSCSAEMGQLCPGVRPQPGAEPMFDCLKSHYAEASAACQKALDVHEAGKRAP